MERFLMCQYFAQTLVQLTAYMLLLMLILSTAFLIVIVSTDNVMLTWGKLGKICIASLLSMKAAVHEYDPQRNKNRIVIRWYTH